MGLPLCNWQILKVPEPEEDGYLCSGLIEDKMLKSKIKNLVHIISEIHTNF